MLETAPAAASWYPVDAYARLTGLLVDVSGGDREAFLHERGAKTARRLAETGIYQQLDRATGEADVDPSALAPEDQIREFGRTVRLVVTLSGSMFDFGRWSVSTDPDHPDRFCITIDEAGAMPDVAIATIEGFVNGIGEQSPTVHHLNWTGTRTAPDRIVYTMDAGVTAVYDGAAD
jgi:hypothetical protein